VTEAGDSQEPQRGFLGRTRDRYRRHPVIAWGSTAVVVGVVIAAVVIVAGSGGSEPANVSIKCSVSDSDGSTALSLQGKVTKKESKEGCDQLAAKLSGPNSYWRVGLPEPPSTYPEIVCGLNAPKGEQGTAIVEVAPESVSSVGTRICGTLAHEGWTQFTHGGVEGPWQVETSEAKEFEEETLAAEEAVQEKEAQEAAEVRQAEQAELEEEEAAYYACETDAREKLDAEREAIQAEYEPLETGDAEHIYEVQEEAEELELAAEGRELHSIGKCQRRIEDEAGEAALVAPEDRSEIQVIH
jgi:hypothetical protein